MALPQVNLKAERVRVFVITVKHPVFHSHPKDSGIVARQPCRGQDLISGLGQIDPVCFHSVAVEAVNSVLGINPDESIRILRDLIGLPAAEDSVKSGKTLRPCREEGQKGQQNQYSNMFLTKLHLKQHCWLLLQYDIVCVVAVRCQR